MCLGGNWNVLKGGRCWQAEDFNTRRGGWVEMCGTGWNKKEANLLEPSAAKSGRTLVAPSRYEAFTHFPDEAGSIWKSRWN